MDMAKPLCTPLFQNSSKDDEFQKLSDVDLGFHVKGKNTIFVSLRLDAL